MSAVIGKILTGATTCTKTCNDARTVYFHAMVAVNHLRKPAAQPSLDPACFRSRSTVNYYGLAATLLLCAEELVSHTATSHLSFSQVRRLLCKQDLAHESLLGLLCSRKVNYQLRLPFLCDSKARRSCWGTSKHAAMDKPVTGQVHPWRGCSHG